MNKKRLLNSAATKLVRCAGEIERSCSVGSRRFACGDCKGIKCESQSQYWKLLRIAVNLRKEANS